MQILFSKDIEISSMIDTYDGFAVLTVNEQHADNIFATEINTELTQNYFTPVMPPDLKAKNSVIIPRVDDLIYENSPVDIGDEIMQQNSWIGGQLENVYKFTNSSTIKITFAQTALAKKCTETGLKAF